MKAAMLMAVLACAALQMVPGGFSSTLHRVGGSKGWNPGVNFTEWALQEHVYAGDWIGFNYDRDYYGVLEVNETAYNRCLSDNPIGNWSKGGTWLQLNHTKRYFFICSGGYCFNGMKVSILVEKRPLTPVPAPAQNINGSPLLSASGDNILETVILTLAAVCATLFGT